MTFMTCYRCLRKVTTKDDILFVARNPVHRGGCPKKGIDILG
jgi:hypothetical protein